MSRGIETIQPANTLILNKVAKPVAIVMLPQGLLARHAQRRDAETTM
jgi:hypothetical protein